MRLFVGLIRGFLALLLLAWLTPASQAVAQGVTTSAVTGRVVDQTGAPLAGAQVSVSDTRTGVTRRMSTSDAGRFYLAHLQPGGPYAIEVQILGYRPAARSGVQLSLGQTETLNFQLEQAAVQLAAVDVIAETDPVFGASRTGTETTITQDEVSTYPTLGRNFADFAELSPHVSIVEGAPSVGGQNNRFNNIQIDGAVNNDVFGLADNGLPGGQVGAKAISIEAIQEFQVLTAPFDVRHSNFTGGLINAVTKSGTNVLHGSGFVFHRNENFVSDLEGEPFGDFNDTQFGFTLGGPIQRDKVHFFVSGEFEIQDNPQPGAGVVPGGSVTDDAIEARVHPDSAARLISIMEGLGFNASDVGTSAVFGLDNPRTNLFGRLDFALSDRHRLVLRHNYARARADRSAFRASFVHSFSSQAQDFTSITNSTVAQLFSTLGDRWQNELLVNVEFVRDERLPVVDIPQIVVENDSDFGATGILGTDLQFGAERFSQANKLDQDVLQITDNLTGTFGNHVVTFGTHNELFSFSNVFLEGSIGLYDFASLADLESGIVDRYQIRGLGAGISNPAAEFSMLSLGGYVQDQWAVNNQLTVTLGFRVDLPISLDDPRENPAFAAAFPGLNTSTIPSGNPSWQPRFGFNWNAPGRYQTQIRGGVGLFSGRPPFVWISNAFGNTGLESTFLSCFGANAPPLDPANYPGNSPQACVDGTTGAGSVSFINLADENFKFPLDLKLSLGVDRELPAGFSVTVEGLFTKSVQQVAFEEVNLQGVQGTDPTQGNRPLFGVPTSSGFAPVRVSDAFPQVVRITNKSENQAFLLSFELKRQFSDWLRFRGSYTYSDVEDTQSLFSSQATSNFGRTAINGDPSNPKRTSSNLARPHKVVLSATGRWDLGKGLDLEVTPQYFGQSGVPYTYTARGDLNGDGYRGGAVSRDNDLIYVPNNAVTDMSFRGGAAEAQEFEDFINSEKCLREARGRLLERNSCRNPWRSRFDLRASVGLPGGGPARVRLVVDVINLFASTFERTSNIDRGINLIRLRGRVGDVPTGDLLFSYEGPVPDPDTGELTPPFTTFSPGSQRQVQLGLRYEF